MQRGCKEFNNQQVTISLVLQLSSNCRVLDNLLQRRLVDKIFGDAASEKFSTSILYCEKGNKYIK